MTRPLDDKREQEIRSLPKLIRRHAWIAAEDAAQAIRDLLVELDRLRPIAERSPTIDLEQLYEVAEDVVEGRLVNWEGEPDGWHEWPTTWQERLAGLGHPRKDGTGYCTLCSRDVTCSLKDFANLIAMTTAKRMADRLGAEIVTPEPNSSAHVHHAWVDVRAARMNNPEAQAGHQAAAEHHREEQQ